MDREELQSTLHLCNCRLVLCRPCQSALKISAIAIQLYNGPCHAAITSDHLLYAKGNTLSIGVGENGSLDRQQVPEQAFGPEVDFRRACNRVVPSQAEMNLQTGSSCQSGVLCPIVNYCKVLDQRCLCRQGRELRWAASAGLGLPAWAEKGEEEEKGEGKPAPEIKERGEKEGKKREEGKEKGGKKGEGKKGKECCD